MRTLTNLYSLCAIAAALIMLLGAGCSTGGSGLGASDGIVGGNDDGNAADGADAAGDGTDGDATGQDDATATCPGDANVTSVTIYANYDNGVRIGRNETLPIRAELEFVDGVVSTTSTVCWASSDPAVMSVSSTGSLSCSIQGESVGSATLTASLGELSSQPLPIHVQEGSVVPGAP